MARVSRPRRLSRTAGDGCPERPVGIVHLGLGNFFRAHQAWYTDRAPDAGRWGIAAFTGRSPELADALTAQDGLYTLISRTEGGDRFRVIGSLSRAHPASDHSAWLGYMRSAAVAIVTVTVTEAGYLRGRGGGLDFDDPSLRADVDALRRDLAAPVATAPARLLVGIVARSKAGLGPIAVMPCDNLPGNGGVAADVVRDVARLVDPGLVTVVERGASFVTTMVDRITPEATDADRAAAQAATGAYDAAAVVTEPFSEWVIGGQFPEGRPEWERAGATITDDVAPFEQRKLSLLNGAHSLLAYGASVLNHVTVADAVADLRCRQWLNEWWDEAAPHLQFPADEIRRYRAALLDRFANPRIRHTLAQIAADGSQKIPVRILPTLLAERAAHRIPVGATRAIAAWVHYLRTSRSAVNDCDGPRYVAAAKATDLSDAVRDVLGRLDTTLAADRDLVEAVVTRVHELSEVRPPGAG